MKTIALRFAEIFAPECGTIAAHQEIINQYGYVWYGKMGSAIASDIMTNLLEQNELRILLIRSGKPERYWAYVSDIQREIPPIEQIPSYYRNDAERFKTWFKITKIIPTEKNVLSKCYVASSGNSLGRVSMHSMNPYFIIDYKEDV